MFLLNGQPADALPLTDRGLQYGDGLFETMVWQDGTIRCWQDHFARLQTGCLKLGIVCPARELLEEELQLLTARAGVSGKQVVKLILTRGSGGRGYRLPQEPRPSRILSLHDFPEYPETFYSEGVRLHLCKTPLGLNPVLAGIKHLNRLEQVLARSEWEDDAYAEGLMLDQSGYVIEGTMSNVFWIRGEKILTPSIERCGVAGILRGRILQAAEAVGIPVEVSEYMLDDLLDAEGVFLSNSVIGIWPVREFLDRRWQPHAIVRQLRQALSA